MVINSTPPKFAVGDTSRLLSEISKIAALCDTGPVKLGDILLLTHGCSGALLTLFLAGPFMLPIPLPGLSVPFGVMIAIFGLSLVTGQQPWLPKPWLNRVLPVALVRGFCQAATKILPKIEPWLKPRWLWVFKHPLVGRSAGLMIVCCGLLLALPLPPGTNAPPALAIVCLSIALLEQDGLCLLLGFILFGLNGIFFGGLAYFGYEAILAFLQRFV